MERDASDEPLREEASDTGGDVGSGDVGSGDVGSGGPSSLPSESGVLRDRALALQRELIELYYARVSERQRITGLDGRTRDATVHFSFRVSPDGASVDPDQLDTQLKQSAYQLADRCAAFPSGHVYCYWCGTFGCEHSTPQHAKEVFAGYSETGQPEWQDFGGLLLDRGDPRIDILYREKSNPLALTLGGGELASRQLRTYGKRSPIYRILGQVSVGYLTVPRKPELGGFAATFQAVEAAGGRSPAHLNILGNLSDGTPVSEALEEWFDPRLIDAINSTRRQLAEIAVRKFSRRKLREKHRQILESLRTMAKNFDRIFRQNDRRTYHSRSRHRNKQRPTAVALRDAQNVSVDFVYRDVEEQTWVVRGPKNRIHVFNDAGRHITSVVYPGETVKQRTTKGKWIVPDQGDVDAFLETIRSLSRSNADSA